MPSRLLESLAPLPLTVHRVDSLAASLRASGPALSLSEQRMRTLDAWADAGLDPATSAPARLELRLRTGMVAARARLGERFTRFDGLVGAGRVSPFDPAHPVSATRLEVYAECPRKFLFERVLGIERRTLPEDLWRIEARDRGSLVHAVLERYVAERIAGAPRSLERLLAIAEDHLDEAAAGGMVGKALLWRMDRAAIHRDLHVFFAEEGDLEPLAAELSFGDPEDDVPALTVALADGRAVRFRGRADRVDRDAEGTLVISDYKTGRQTGISKLSGDPLDGGKRLQLPLYAMAARQAFGWEGPVLARYWMVSSERAAARYQLELTDAVERHFGEVVARIVRGVDAGCFPAIPGAPRDTGFEGCMWCDFDLVCPATRDRQWAAKRDRAELAPVADLLDVEAPEPLPGLVVRNLPDPPSST
jgi:RecB family exonuclease